ncbi:sulfate adenylyltransferase subunit CysN [Deltaproteobacteria bacterium]|nr:sulfate adenylyltransferase subunit CysN [Deltaproteobacteria bacterium]
MAHISNLIADDIHEYLSIHEKKDLLRFITCGSVDDGKSTLIGRLLFESKMLFDDHLAALETESKKAGTQGDELDLALLVDGLAAEREQGITIDVAYRFFSTDKRKFIVADTPGHQQYTRNMATGASTADIAILLIDARQGVLEQTRRHSFIVSMLGVKHVLLAVNKMDLVDYSEDIFRKTVDDYSEFVRKALKIDDFIAIPVSALKGDNIVERSAKTPWYTGPTLMEHLETVDISAFDEGENFRLPVQWVNRPNPEFRGFSGTVANGQITKGGRVKIIPSGSETTVKDIVTWDGNLQSASKYMSITLTLNDEIDISRGDVITSAESPCESSDQFQARILWMSEDPMMPGRQYSMKLASTTTTITPAKPKHKIDVNTLELLPAKILKLNEIGVCNISLDRKIPFDPYDINRTMGGFIIIDKITNDTVGMGLIDFELRRASNIHWQKMEITKTVRAQQKNQKPCLIWMTGLSGSGKSTIASLLEKKLHKMGCHTITLDGDNIRHGLNRDLGFTSVDRVENIRRVAEVSKLMLDAGLITITSFISPFISEREMARSLMGEGEFVEVHIHTPLEVAESRDVKGLYKKARAGELKNFTGIDSPYEEPKSPQIRVDTSIESVDLAVSKIMDWLQENNFI